MIFHRRAVASNWRCRLTRVAWVAPAVVLRALVTRDQQYSLAKVSSALLWQSALNVSRIECGRWASLPVKPRDRTRVSVPVDTWRLRTPPGGVSVPSLLRGPDSIWGPEPAGVRDSLGGPGPPAVLAEAYLLRATWRHRTLSKRGAGPGPSCRESRAQDHRGPAARLSGRS